jgi:predicted DsbA family dithiol-disulfide isomerase
VRLAQQLAVESDLVTADLVEVTEFPHLAQRYSVRAVPRTVVNETVSIEGALPESEFVKAVVAAARKS